MSKMSFYKEDILLFPMFLKCFLKYAIAVLQSVIGVFIFVGFSVIFIGNFSFLDKRKKKKRLLGMF